MRYLAEELLFRPAFAGRAPAKKRAVCRFAMTVPEIEPVTTLTFKVFDRVTGHLLVVGLRHDLLQAYRCVLVPGRMATDAGRQIVPLLQAL